jgi:NAD-dependent dihydropyrimidine dehydrogenase PreA subunit
MNLITVDQEKCINCGFCSKKLLQNGAANMLTAAVKATVLKHR